MKKLVEISEGKIQESEYLSYTNGVSLERLSDKFERLAVILKIDNIPPGLDEIISMNDRQARTDARKAIFAANGTEISSSKRYLLVRPVDQSTEEDMDVSVEFDGNFV